MEVYVNSRRLDIGQPIPQEFLDTRFGYQNGLYFGSGCELTVDGENKLTYLKIGENGGRVNDYEPGYTMPTEIPDSVWDTGVDNSEEESGFTVYIEWDHNSVCTAVTLCRDPSIVEIGSKRVSLLSGYDVMVKNWGEPEQLDSYGSVWKLSDNCYKYLSQDSEGYTNIMTGIFTIAGLPVNKAIPLSQITELSPNAILATESYYIELRAPTNSIYLYFSYITMESVQITRAQVYY